MKPISELIQPPMFKTAVVRSPLNEQINAVMDMMGEDFHDAKRYGYWCGRLRKLKDRPERIYQLVKQAKTGKNPPALFNHLLKKEVSGLSTAPTCILS